MVFKVRHFIVAFFTTVNVIGYCYFLFGGEATKGASGVNADFLDMTLVISTMLFSLFGLYWYYYHFLIKLSIPRFNLNLHTMNRFGEDILGSGVLLLILTNYLLSYSSGYSAGKEDVVISGALSYLLALFQVQNISLVYLVCCYNSRLWKLNALVFCATSILTGWTSFILVFFVLYLFEKERLGELKWTKVFSIMSIILAIYPIIYFLRFYFRIGGVDGQVTFETLLFSADLSNVHEYISYSFFQLIERLQQFYLNYSIWVHREELSLYFDLGQIYPFYFEGIHRNILGGMFFENATPLGNFLPSILYTDVFGKASWNVSPGLYAWGLSGSFAGLLFFFYILVMVALPIFLLKLIGAPGLARNFVFLNVILLLFHGWVGQYFNFVWSVFVFVLLVIVVNYVRKFLFR
ncbi:TPA: oligosaccharide repeat unit polymerase [Vibrio vulnificus]|nr:oligosaccharide repeat unit polymerase [Vibrio vulnificus]